MSVKLRVEETGVSEAITQLDELSMMLRDGPGLTVMQEVGEAAMAEVHERFNTEGYGTWVPLSPLTIAQKGGNTEILVDTGEMRQSVGIGEVKPKLVTVTVPYGGEEHDPEVPRRHQLGDYMTNLPQRKIVEKTWQLLQWLDKPVLKWVRSWGPLQ